MRRNILWIIVSCLMALSLLMVSCGQEEVEEESGKGIVVKTEKQEQVEEQEEEVQEEEEEVVVSDEPQYGGTISLVMTLDPTFDLLGLGKNAGHLLSHQYLWDGDWAKGPAGGYGTAEVPWAESTNVPDLNAMILAESIEFILRPDDQEVDTVITVRQGVHFAFNDNEAGRLVGGREVTADDVLFSMNEFQSNPDSQNLQLFPGMRDRLGTKTGPWEITFTFPYKEHLDATMRLLGLTVIYPPEVYEKYGADFSDAENDVGTGPYMITDYVAGSIITLKKNPNYWMKDPVGPGKGNQLPYIDNVRFLVIVDESTRQAAMRTGKLDQLTGFTPEAAGDMAMRTPELMAAETGTWSIWPMYMNTTQAPFDNVKVRRAMMMATDFNDINDSLYGGAGQILSWPTWKTPAYEGIYLGLDDPEMPDSVKELYSYNPDKAKELLKEAGYPDGFQATLLLTQPNADYYSIIENMWAKVGIDITLNVVDMGALVPMAFGRDYELLALFYAPNSTWPEQANYTNVFNWVNGSILDDPIVNAGADEARVAAMTDFKGAMSITKELMKHLLDQAYAIPTPRYPQTNMWWPWLKNYTGETAVGYFPGSSWVQFIWIDEELKESMGY